MKNRNRFVVGICYLAVGLLLIRASGCPVGNFSGITISGKVTDANGDAVKSATVRTTPTTEIVKTDETGYYGITGVYAGQYTFEVSKAGYKTKTEEVTVGQMDALSCNGGVKRINLELEQELDETGKPKAKTGGIEGTITDAETGRGIHGCTVTTEVATKEVGTDTNGKYAIDEVSVGAYTVKVKKSGYYDKTVAGQEVTAGSVTTVDVKMVKVLENKGVISGRVTSDTGAGIAGAAITTSPATSDKTTDASGNYEITNVSVGDYTIAAVKTGYDTGTKAVTVKKGEQANGDMSLTINVSVFNATVYNFAMKWGSNGSGDGQFYAPHAVAIDSSGNVYVADNGNHRIQKFTSTGTFITKWGSQGSGDGQFSFPYGPYGVAIDGSGNIYVADYDNRRIQKFTSTGTFITKWGSSGTGDGQFNNPWGVAIDSSGNVYVADNNNSRIQKFSSTGTFITKWGSGGTGDGQFNIPWGVAIDGSGNVYVADEYNNRIQKFTSTGTFITKWGSNGTGDGQFYYPVGVAIDGSGNVYVVDEQNHRIQKFTPGN